VIKRKSK